MIVDQALRQTFKETAFLLGKFPVLTQTFIYRELAALRRRGLPFNMISTKPTDFPDGALEPEIRELRRECVYLRRGSPRHQVEAFKRMSAEPKFGQTMRWMASLKHRDIRHRFRALRAVAAAAYLAPELRARGIKHIHAHFADHPTEIAMSLARMLGITYSCSWHAVDIFQDQNILVDKMAGAARILCCTQANLEHLKALAPHCADRLRLVYHGVDVPQSASSAPPSQATHFLAVGRLIEKKGFGHLIEAVQCIATAGHDVRLEIVGEGKFRPRLERQISNAGLGERVTLCGALTNPAVMTKMAAARALVVPSVQAANGDIDGIPNVILEAMGQGRPVLASSLPSITEAVRNEENGLLAAPKDSAGLAKQLTRLIVDNALVDRLGQTAGVFVRANFSAEQNVNELVAQISAARREQALNHP